MTEWVMLVVLVPAVIVPVVLLWGFADCDVVCKLKERPAAPQGVAATPTSESAMTVDWLTVATGQTFEVHRAADGGPFEVVANISAPPFIDPPYFGNPPPLQARV